jgi:outer membrane protein
MKKLLLYTILSISISSPTYATDLMDVYYEALKNDTVFKNAYDVYMANAEAIPQARAALLPQINFSGQGNRSFMFVDDGVFSLRKYYTSKLWEASASQALFNYESLSRVRQAKASVKTAQATFNDAAQNLILRTAKAYFDVLYSQDILDYSEAKKRANKRQYEQAQYRFQVGLDAMTAVYEAKAAYKLSKAAVIAAHNNQENQSENLRKLTNSVYPSLSPLRDNKIPLIKPEPNNADNWIHTGLDHNYRLLAAKYNIEIARENMKALSAGNWPTIALQSNTVQVYNNIGNQENNPVLPKSQRQSNIGLALNFQAFQGGLVHSQTRQAQFQFQSASEQFEQAHREVIVNSRVTFNTIMDGISKVKADREAVVAQSVSLKSTEAQFEVGKRTMVDVVNAQQRLFEAQQFLANDQYNLINSILTLKYMAGSLNVNDLELINSWLATTRVYGYDSIASKNKKNHIG